MDPFTHALSGAAIARATAPAQPAEGRFSVRERLLLGGGAALFPDIDWVIRLFADDLTYLNFHRGVTHSILMLPLWALLLGWLAARFWRGRRDWREAAFIIGLGIGIHIAGDFITNYGTHLFAPLVWYPLAFPSTFIIDPWITLTLLVGVLLAWRWDSRLAARLGLGLAVSLVLFQGVMKLHALKLAESQAALRPQSPVSAHAMPQPVSPLHWRLILETETGHLEAHLGFLRGRSQGPEADAGVLRRHWQSFRPPSALEWQWYPRFGKDLEFTLQAWKQPEFEGFREFAGLPYFWGERVIDGDRCAVFTDLRFRIEGLDRTPFRFAMCQRPDGAWYRKRIGPW
ncbi:metal-dependent hydrolase [Natronospira bacteriovora]|uniref:Metal-dependent hydrolase n=1 Tax=Natronospira bacteriovora TaxID=3069753 RepID=A0ABU0W8M0_9GAMM|nr:metal-dependent hydrolase [Natronospira sp. AB-CW4]MDQ2070259.1 metal-dependent hydrolase [Natronospira sp. AB-CW4]